MDIETFKIIVAIAIRIYAGFAAYFTVIRALQRERALIAPELRDYNTKLILSVISFIVTCFGTSIFQACRAGWLPYCDSVSLLDNLAIFNSLGLFSAWYVMNLMVTYKPVLSVSDSKKIAQIKADVVEVKAGVVEVKKDVKIVKKKIDVESHK